MFSDFSDYFINEDEEKEFFMFGKKMLIIVLCILSFVAGVFVSKANGSTQEFPVEIELPVLDAGILEYDLKIEMIIKIIKLKHPEWFEKRKSFDKE